MTVRMLASLTAYPSWLQPPSLWDFAVVCAILSPTSDKWSASLCRQKKSGGPLYKSTKQSGFTGSLPIEMRGQAFVAIPLSDLLAGVTVSLTRLWK